MSGDTQDPVRLAGPDVTGGADIFALRLTDHKSQPFVQTRFFESGAQFSSDGRWVAYLSVESGGEEIYVQSFPGPGRKWQVSADGGTEPVWNPNGRELFYRGGNKMMAVNIATQPVFAAGRPTLLFTGDYMLGSTASQL
jgi:Tol biopolymer transport system component